MTVARQRVSRADGPAARRESLHRSAGPLRNLEEAIGIALDPGRGSTRPIWSGRQRRWPIDQKVVLRTGQPAGIRGHPRLGRAGPLKRTLTWPGALAIQISSTCDHVVRYDQPRHAVCIEPQTGPHAKCLPTARRCSTCRSHGSVRILSVAPQGTFRDRTRKSILQQLPE